MLDRLRKGRGEISKSTHESNPRQIGGDVYEYIESLHKIIESLNDQIANLTGERDRLTGALGEIAESKALSRGQDTSKMLGEALHHNLGMQAEIKRCHDKIRSLGGKV